MNGLIAQKSLKFKEFLIEMETSNDEKNRIREVIQKLIENDKKWLKEKDIYVGDKGDFWILNYGQEQVNPYNSLFRGMVIKKPEFGFQGDLLSLIKSFPFIRFFNQKEVEKAAHVDLNNADMIDKLDGTFVGVFFPYDDPSRPEFHTRKLLSTSAQDFDLSITSFHGKKYKFLPLIKSYVDNLKFDESDIEFTYIFEFIHEASYVVTKYSPEKYGLYLLAGRNVKTHKELLEKELDKKAIQFGVNRPNRYDSVADQDQIQKLLDQISKEVEDFEGSVFRDRTTGNRIKLKRDDYLRKHRMIDKGNYKELIPSILEGEESEILAYLPYLKSRIDEFKNSFNKFIEEAFAEVLSWKKKNLSPAELASNLFGKNELKAWERRLKKIPLLKADLSETEAFKRNLVMKYSKFPEDIIKEKITKELIELGTKTGSSEPRVKKLISILNLKDDDEDSNQKQISDQ